MYEWNSGKKPSGRLWNQLLDAVVTMIEYKKITIYLPIYIKVFYDGTVYYLVVSTDYFLNTTNNDTEFPQLRRVFEEDFEIKSQEGSVLKYLNYRMFQSPIGSSVNQTDLIMELVY